MTPSERLEKLFAEATETSAAYSVLSGGDRERLAFVCLFVCNRACVRLLIVCLLAKLDVPDSDPRKPYREIGTPDCFPGQAYDALYVTPFIHRNGLPFTATGAFLTPSFRNFCRPLTVDVELVGRPRKLYADTLILLDRVASGILSAKAVLLDALRLLIRLRDERAAELLRLEAELRKGVESLPLSAEGILTLLRQHLACPHSSRLPVLIVAAAYEVAGSHLGESARPLHAHNAADFQTGAAGDIEITLVGDDRTRTVYEMKQKAVTRDNIDAAVVKLSKSPTRIDSYIFICTEPWDATVDEYAKQLYESTGGTEVIVLDCLGFSKHFLHLFHRLRADYLNAYQRLLLAEPESAVGTKLKEVFLALRLQAVSVS